MNMDKNIKFVHLVLFRRFKFLSSFLVSTFDKPIKATYSYNNILFYIIGIKAIRFLPKNQFLLMTCKNVNSANFSDDGKQLPILKYIFSDCSLNWVLKAFQFVFSALGKNHVSAVDIFIICNHAFQKLIIKQFFTKINWISFARQHTFRIPI